MFNMGCSKNNPVTQTYTVAGTGCSRRCFVYRHIYQVNITGAVRCNLPLPQTSAFREDWVSGNSANNAIQVNENRAVWIALLECKLLQAQCQDPALNFQRISWLSRCSVSDILERSSCSSRECSWCTTDRHGHVGTSLALYSRGPVLKIQHWDQLSSL